MNKNKNDIKTLEDIENEFSKLYTWFVFTFIFFAMLVVGFILATFKINKLEEKINDNSVQAGAFVNNDVDSFVITDLTGTSWEFNNIIDTSNSFTYNLSFTSNNISFIGLYLDFGDGEFGYTFSGSITYAVYDIYDDSWTNNAYKSISITGGTDATSVSQNFNSLLSWLQDNATPQSSTTTYNITTNLTNLTASGSTTIDSDSTATVTLSANTGYHLPTTISVTNADYTYNSTTGVITLSNATDNVTITAVGRHIYNINISVDTGINSSITDTFVESSGDVKYYIFTCSSNYVFDSILSYSYNNNIYSYSWNDDNLISDLSGTLSNFTISHSGYEGLSIQFDNVQSDISFTINSTGGFSISNKTFILDLTLYYNSGFSMINPLIYRVFTSNEKTFYKIIKNDLNNFEYLNQSTLENSVDVFTFLNGQYLPYDTYNYQLISFDSYLNLSSNYQLISQVRDWLRADDDFFYFYRVASQTDLNNINFKNEQLIRIQENTSFLSLFSAILDAQFLTLKGLLNFNIFGINLFSILTLFISLSLVFLVIRFIRGGGHKKDE